MADMTAEERQIVKAGCLINYTEPSLKSERRTAMTRESYLAQFYGKSQNYTDIPNKWYKEYNVKKGLRNEDGTGVRGWAYTGCRCCRIQ